MCYHGSFISSDTYFNGRNGVSVQGSNVTLFSGEGSNSQRGILQWGYFDGKISGYERDSVASQHPSTA